MTRFSLNDYKEGLPVSCENCHKTATIQEDGNIPLGWWALIDRISTAGLFCSVSCAYHYLARLVGEEVKNIAVQKRGTFN